MITHLRRAAGRQPSVHPAIPSAFIRVHLRPFSMTQTRQKKYAKLPQINTDARR